MEVIFSYFSPAELILCLSIVFFAGILQMTLGMGFGMLASPLIALVKPEIVPGSILIIGLVVASAGTIREWRNISIVEMKLGIGGRVLGSLGALFILANITDISGFLLVFGLLSLLGVLLAGFGIRFAFTNSSLFHLSTLSGLMGTITAIGAPPMAVIYHDRPPSVVRPTLNAFFGGGCVLGLVTLAASGWLHMDDLWAALLFLPAMLVGIYVSRFFMGISSQILSILLLGLAGLASLALIYRGLALLLT